MADFTVASKVEAPKIDPLAMVGKVNEVQKGLLNNRLLDQQIRSKVAVGQAITAAADPDTGKIDWDKAGAALAQDPDGAFAVPEFTAASQARRLADLNLSKEQVATSLAKLKPASELALALIGNAKQEPLTKETIIKGIKTGLIDTGILSLEADGQMLQGIVGQLTDDPVQNQVALQRLYAQTHATTEGLNTLFGTPQSVNTGSGTAIIRTAPAGGSVPTVAGVVDKNLSPSEENTPAYTYTDDKGVQHIVTKKQAAEAGGGTPEGIRSGLPTGAPQTAAANVEQAVALQKRAAIVPERKAALSEIVGTLDKFTPGPKANLTGTINGLAAQFGLPVSGATEGAAAQDTFNKLASQIALQQWGALGGTGSNEQLGTAAKTNPTETMSKMGIKNVVALLQGNEDAIGAQFDAWQKYSKVHGPASYGDFIGGWNRYFDPRVYQAQHMSPKHVKEMLAEMSEKERKTFARNKSVAEQAGWLK